VTMYLPSKPTRHESNAQERANERKAEEKQIERLLAVLSKKLAHVEPSVKVASESLAH